MKEPTQTRTVCDPTDCIFFENKNVILPYKLLNTQYCYSTTRPTHWLLVVANTHALIRQRH